jgi:CheY-like chemotaxis protein
MPDDVERPVEEAETKIIFIVEDDADVGEFLIEAIKILTPYQVLLAHDGFQALKMVKTLKPDLFVLDYLLPGMNGLELYDHFRATEALEQVPTLFMSANMPEKEAEKRHAAYIKKPFEFEDLLQLIEQLLASSWL